MANYAPKSHAAHQGELDDQGYPSQGKLGFARIKQQRQLYQRIVWYAIVTAVASIVIGVGSAAPCSAQRLIVSQAGAGLKMLGQSEREKCSNACAAVQGYEGCFNPTQFWGLTIQVYLVPIGVLALGACIVEFGQRVCSSQTAGFSDAASRRATAAKSA